MYLGVHSVAKPAAAAAINMSATNQYGYHRGLLPAKPPPWKYKNKLHQTRYCKIFIFMQTRFLLHSSVSSEITLLPSLSTFHHHTLEPIDLRPHHSPFPTTTPTTLYLIKPIISPSLYLITKLPTPSLSTTTSIDGTHHDSTKPHLQPTHTPATFNNPANISYLRPAPTNNTYKFLHTHPWPFFLPFRP
jgi:hypothetical protein